MSDSNQAAGADQLAVRRSPCLHFLSKGMFVSGKIEPTREVDGMGDGHCWCNMTQYIMGPDRQLVDRETCDAARTCYQPRL